MYKETAFKFVRFGLYKITSFVVFVKDLIFSMSLNFGKKFVIFNMYLIFSMTTEIVSEGVDINIVALTSQLW